MSVKKQSNGKWYCRFTIRGERKHLLCIGATNKAEAEDLEAQYKYRLMQQQNGVMPRDTKNIYFKRLKDLYSKPVNKIKPVDIEAFKTYLKTQNLKNSSINRYLEILSKMFNLAIDNKELTENPVSKAGMLREDNIDPRFLSADEERRLYKSIDKFAPYLRPIVTIALQTGMRRGEILNLKWTDIKDGYIQLLETKSGNSRNIPTSTTLLNALKFIPKVSEYVFINPKTNKPYTDIKKSWHKVLNKANIENFRFHDLRHTVATRMVEKGIDLLVVKDILGHTMIETTMRYAHPVPERVQAAIEVLNDYK